MKNEQIDLGLALLSCLAEPGVPLTYRDIAAWCGCAHNRIYEIEASALRNLRQRLPPEIREMIQCLPTPSRVAEFQVCRAIAGPMIDSEVEPATQAMETLFYPFNFFMVLPWLALVPAAFFGMCWLVRGRGVKSRQIVLITAIMWLAYAGWEWWMSITMKPEDVPIRIDMLIIGPLLYFASGWSIIALFRPAFTDNSPTKKETVMPVTNRRP